MKIKLILVAALLLIIKSSFCQSEIYRNSSILEKVLQVKNMDIAMQTSESVEIEKPVRNVSRIPGDSAKREYKTIQITTNRVRLDAEKVKQLFPESVTTSSEGDVEIDYFSLVAILFEAMSKQQAKIEELNSKIMILEKK